MATHLLRTLWGMALNVYFRRKKSFSFVNFLKNLHFMRRLSREVIFLLNSENPWVSTPKAAPKYTHMNSTTYWSHGQHDFAHITIGFFLFPLFHLLPSITDLCLCRRECQHTWKLLVRVGGEGQGEGCGRSQTKCTLRLLPHRPDKWAASSLFHYSQIRYMMNNRRLSFISAILIVTVNVISNPLRQPPLPTPPSTIPPLLKVPCRALKLS